MMDDFERSIRGDIPLADAASFFLRTKTFNEMEKLGSRVQDTIADLLAGRMPEKKAGYNKAAPPVDMDEKTAAILKVARRVSYTDNDNGTRTFHYDPSDPSKDRTVSQSATHVPPMSKTLRVGKEKTALSRHAGKKAHSDRELKHTGKDRGTVALASEAQREKGRRGSRAGTALGQIAGGLGGAVAGKKYIGGKAGTIAGLIMGSSAGKRLGHELGTEADIAKNASRVDVMRANFRKLAQGDEMDPAAGVDLGQPQQQAPAPAPQQGPSGAPNSQAPVKPPQMPTNYLKAEMAGAQAQQQNEAVYYKQIAEQSEQQIAQMQEEIGQTQQQLEQISQQAAATAGQVQVATQNAQDAQDRATNHSMEAANMRMAAQRMREAMFELAQQEPESFSPAGQQAAAAQEMAAQQGMDPNADPNAPPEEGGAPPPEGGPPQEGAPPEGGPPQAGGQPPAAAAPQQPPAQEAAPKKEPERTITVKTSAQMGQLAKMLLVAGGGGLAGAGIGALSARSRMNNSEKLRVRAESLKSKGAPGNFREAMTLARAESQAGEASVMKQYPGPAMAAGARSGALRGVLHLPGQAMAAMGAGRGIAQNISELRGG